MSDWRSRALSEPSSDWKSRALPEPIEEPGLLKKAGKSLLSGIETVAESVGRYTSAPARSAVYSLQDDIDLGKAAKAFGSQFGRPTEEAPTGEMIAKKAGVPSEYAPAAGLAADILIDPTLVLPVGSISKGLVNTAKSTVGAAKSATGLLSKTVSGAGKKLATSAGELLTGVPKREIETYVNKFPTIEKNIKQFGESIPDLADKVRESFSADIQRAKSTLNKQISSALESLPKERVVDVSDVLGSLEKSKANLLGSKRIEEANQVQGVIDKASRFFEKVGPADSFQSSISSANPLKEGAIKSTLVSPQDAFSLKNMLQDIAESAYRPDGSIFNVGSEASKAAKDAARLSRKHVNKASPTIADANNQLSKLHVVEKKINKNLIAPGKPEAGLLSAGSGINQRNIKNLQRLEEITGTPLLEKAEELSATKRFSSPGLTAADSTGKAVERMAKGGLIGLGFGGAPGAAIGAAITSPMALKMAVKSGKISSDVIHAIAGTAGKITDTTINNAYEVIKTKKGAAALDQLIRNLRVEGEEAARGLITGPGRKYAGEEKK